MGGNAPYPGNPQRQLCEQAGPLRKVTSCPGIGPSIGSADELEAGRIL